MSHDGLVNSEKITFPKTFLGSFFCPELVTTLWLHLKLVTLRNLTWYFWGTKHRTKLTWWAYESKWTRVRSRLVALKRVT